MTKEQGLDKGMHLRSGPLQLNFSETYKSPRIPDAYERLLLEVMKGNQNLFVRKDEIEYAWKWCDQLIDGWQRVGAPPKPYAAGSWGPAASRSEEHTSDLQSLMRISYAVFCLQKKTT